MDAGIAIADRAHPLRGNVGKAGQQGTPLDVHQVTRHRALQMGKARIDDETAIQSQNKNIIAVIIAQGAQGSLGLILGRLQVHLTFKAPGIDLLQHADGQVDDAGVARLVSGQDHLALFQQRQSEQSDEGSNTDHHGQYKLFTNAHQDPWPQQQHQTMVLTIYFFPGDFQQ